MAIFDILPFGSESAEAQLEAFFQGTTLRQASGYQCLRLLKFLGVEQRAVAAHLEVTVSTVSMWANRVRGVPAKYQEAIRMFAARHLREACERKIREWQALPGEQLQLAAAREWWAGWRRWELEVQHEEGLLTAAVDAACRQIGAYAGTELKSADRQALRHLCQTLHTELRTLDEIETAPPEERHQDASGA
jgi:hypothetical protein